MRIYRKLAVLTLVLVVSTFAFSWAPGTHAYVANKLNHGISPANTMFGAVLPDINQVLSSDQNSIFFQSTHYGFDGVWGASALLPAPARILAFGYVSHNEAWGADYYAHIKSNLYPRYVNPDPRYQGQNGYVWVKAQQLCTVLKWQLKQSGQASPLSDIMLSDPMNCHFIVEYAMDIVLKMTRDPNIGHELLVAASSYDSSTMNNLFALGYPGPVLPFPDPLGPQPMGVGMAAYQGAWAYLIQIYATALDQPTLQQTIPAVSQFLEMLAEQLLGDTIRGILGLPPGYPLPDAVKQQLLSLINLGLTDSVALCALDYNFELDATVRAVNHNMQANRIH